MEEVNLLMLKQRFSVHNRVDPLPNNLEGTTNQFNPLSNLLFDHYGITIRESGHG